MREFHPVADLFPLVEGEEFKTLVADIRSNGLLFPIMIDLEGRILDGRNRARACKEIGIDPPATVYEGTDPAAVIVSANIHRRHLTRKQRAFIAAELARMRPGRPIPGNAGISQRQAAAMLEVSLSDVELASTISKSTDPDLIAAAKDGPIALRPAADRVRAARPTPAEPPAPKRGTPESRAYRVERIREKAALGYASRQMAKLLGYREGYILEVIKTEKIDCPGDRAVKGTRRIYSDRVLENVVTAAEHITTGSDLIDFSEIDPRSMQPWIDRLRLAAKELAGFIRLCEKHMKGSDHEGQSTTDRPKEQKVLGSDRFNAHSHGRSNTTAH